MALDTSQLKDMAEEHGTIEMDGLDSVRDAVGAVLTLTHYSVDVLTRNLDRRVFDNAHVVAELKRVSLGSHRARVRVLIHDAKSLVRREHRLWLLMRRLPSYFQVRVPSADYRDELSAFLVADSVASVYQPHGELYEGQTEFYNPMRARELQRKFSEIWERAQPSPELRTMTI